MTDSDLTSTRLISNQTGLSCFCCGLWGCGQRPCVVHISTGLLVLRTRSQGGSGRGAHNGAVTNLLDGQARRRPKRPSLGFDAVPHTVPSTYAGALFQALRSASMRGRARAGGAGSVVRVCPLSNAGAYLQLLRPWSDLLCRRLCAGGPISRPACRRSSLPDEPPRAPGSCGTGPSLSGAAKGKRM